MPRDREDVTAALRRKGFRQDGGDHEFFIYHNLLGKKTMKKTKVSRGSGYKTLSDDLISKMSKQVGLTKKMFLDFVDCKVDQKTYEECVFPS